MRTPHPADLVALKAATHQFGVGEVPDLLARLVDAELTRAERFESAVRPGSEEAQELSEAFFERVVTRSRKNALTITPRISSQPPRPDAPSGGHQHRSSSSPCTGSRR